MHCCKFVSISNSDPTLDVPRFVQCGDIYLNFTESRDDFDNARIIHFVLSRPRACHLDFGTQVKGYFAAGVMRYSNSVSTFNISRLARCGDIELNPGPEQSSSTLTSKRNGSLSVLYLNVRSLKAIVSTPDDCARKICKMTLLQRLV